MKYRALRVATLLAFFWLLVGVAQADEKKIALQISDDSPEKQTQVLNVANNLIKHYGQDNVQIEIVTFGPGLKLLFAENANHDRVQSLSVSGVQFAVCQNTLTAMTKSLGRSPAMAPEGKVVPAGVVRLVELADQGYVIIRP
jgi:intracellular sulfur oxidation DsrE/DsrF family protein